jgi:hypothetical protein
MCRGPPLSRPQISGPGLSCSGGEDSSRIPLAERAESRAGNRVAGTWGSGAVGRRFSAHGQGIDLSECAAYPVSSKAIAWQRMTVLWPIRAARTIAACRVWAMHVTACHFLAENGLWDVNPRMTKTQRLTAAITAIDCKRLSRSLRF